MATYKGVGLDTTNARIRSGTSSDDISFDAQITATDALSVTGGTTTDTLTVTGDASVGGDFTVTGDIISRGAVDLVVQDNFIDLNFGNTTTTVESGGLTVQMRTSERFCCWYGNNIYCWCLRVLQIPHLLILVVVVQLHWLLVM